MPKAVMTYAKARYGGSEASQWGKGACGTSERKQRNRRKKASEQPKEALGIGLQFLFFEKYLPYCHQSLETSMYKGIARWWQI